MWIIFIIACLICLVDQATKLYVELHLSTKTQVDVIDGFLYFTKSYNTGAGWSIMGDSTLLLALISLFAAVILIYITVKKLKHFKGNIMPSICMALAIGGCVGNMVDRFMTVFHLREGVIDFVGMYIFNYGWPIYNVADIALVLGIVLFAIWALFFDKNDKINKSIEGGDDNA